MRNPAFHSVLMCLILLLGAIPTTGQEKKGVWYGSAELGAGSNFSNGWTDLHTAEVMRDFSRTSGDIKLNGGWKNDRWDVSLNTGAKTSYLRTGFEGCSYTLAGRDTTYNVDLSQTEKVVSNFSVGTAISYKPGDSDTFFFSFKHEQDHQEPNHIIYSLKYRNSIAFQGSDEQGDFFKMTFEPKFNWTHNFAKPGRILKASLGWFYASDDRKTIWEKGNVDIGEKLDTVYYTYRLTPLYKDSDFKASFQYSDTDFADVKNLNLTFFLNNTVSTDVDIYSGASLKEGEWVDSIRLKENFNYLTVMVEPGAKAAYKKGQFNFDYSFSLQYFTDRLNDIGTGQREGLDLGRLDPVVSLKNWWSPSSKNKVGLHYTRDIKRPDYLQLCWFQRPGVLSNEIREGNANLRPTVTDRLSVDYKFTHNRFNAGLEFGIKNVTDQIEQTFYQTDIDGISYRVYTYVNAGYACTGNVKINAGWSGKVVKGHLEANLNNFVGLNSKGNETRSNDINIKADADCSLPLKLRLQAFARYQSKITRVYGSMSSYVGCDLKLSRAFGKLTVFLEGNDLFDKPVELETYSEDFTSGRIQTTHNNRRQFRLGLSIKV